MTRTIPRPIARAPIGMFKAGFGWLFGGMLVMVEHIGRTSGQRRYVVLEVVAAEPGAVVVASGYGTKAQWFRNVRADPRVRLWRGRTNGVRAHADVLTLPEAKNVFEAYRRENPRRARFVARSLAMPALAESGPLPDDVGETVPLVRFTVVSA